MNFLMFFDVLKSLIDVLPSDVDQLVFDLFFQKFHRLYVYQQPRDNSGDLQWMQGSEMSQQNKRYLIDGCSAHSKTEFVDEVRADFGRFFDGGH